MITSSEEQTLKRAEHHLILHYIYIYVCSLPAFVKENPPPLKLRQNQAYDVGS